MVWLKTLVSLPILALGLVGTYISIRAAWEFGIFPALVKRAPDRYPKVDWLDKRIFLREPLWEKLVIAFGFGVFAPFFLWKTFMILMCIWGVAPFAEWEDDGRGLHSRPAGEVLIITKTEHHRYMENGCTAGGRWVEDAERNEQAQFFPRTSWEKVEELLPFNRSKPTVLAGCKGDLLVNTRGNQEIERSYSSLFNPWVFRERLAGRPFVDGPGQVGDRVQAHVQKQEIDRVGWEVQGVWLSVGAYRTRIKEHPVRGQVEIRTHRELSFFSKKIRLFLHPTKLLVGHPGQRERTNSDPELDRPIYAFLPAHPRHKNSLRGRGVQLSRTFTERGDATHA